MTHGNQGSKMPKKKPPRLRRRYIGLILLLLMLAVLGIIIWAMGAMSTTKATPEILLPLFLIIGVTVLMVVLMAVALTANFIVGRKGEKPEALGMPAGSVSAVIALMLLLVFATFTVFLFTQIRSGEGEGFVSRGVTVDVLKNFPQNRILGLSVENPEAAAAERTYELTLAAGHPDSIDFAKNAATLVGTLLAAVAGFYFGGKATERGVDAGKSTSAGNANQENIASAAQATEVASRAQAPAAIARYTGDAGPENRA